VDDCRAGVTALLEQIGQLAPTLSVLYLYDQDGLYLFENGVRLDLTYKRRSEVRTASVSSDDLRELILRNRTARTPTDQQ